MVFKNGVKNTQVAAYYGERMVYCNCTLVLYAKMNDT